MVRLADPALAPLLAPTLEKTLSHIALTIPKLGLERPRIGRPDLTYEPCGLNDWVDGFWPGQLWLSYRRTGDDAYRRAAEAYRPYFIGRLGRREGYTHDFGFLYSLSAVAEWKVTGNREARDIAFAAAEILAGRYNPIGRFIQAWNEEPLNEIDAMTGATSPNAGKMIIDCMVNLGLLYWAARESGEARFADAANGHAETSKRFLIRPDFSTVHTFRFDPATGRPIEAKAYQGFGDNSCWSRGHSWAIYGFTQAHRYTGRADFLETAVRLADYAIKRLPEDSVPAWDYLLDEGAPRHRDSSAASMMAAGLIDLADHVADEAASLHYREVSARMLESLIRNYSLIDNPAAEGLLDHGASFVRIGLHDTMLPYGDYFFLEALLRHSGEREFFW